MLLYHACIHPVSALRIINQRAQIVPMTLPTPACPSSPSTSGPRCTARPFRPDQRLKYYLHSSLCSLLCSAHYSATTVAFCHSSSISTNLISFSVASLSHLISVISLAEKPGEFPTIQTHLRGLSIASIVP